jgi:hypothetical protein
MTAQQLIKSEYQGAVQSFTDDGWFNATSAAAKYGKTPNDWLRLPTTQEYLAALDRKYGKIPHYKTKRGATGGTWLSPKLAVTFARWLDIDFAVWCDEQIDGILRGKIDQKKLRHEAAASFKVMTSVLQLVREEQGKVTASHHYSNEARLVNWAASGKFQSINRDELSASELDLMAKLEEKNTVLIGRGVGYDARKTILAQYAIDLRPANLLTSKPEELVTTGEN